MTEVLLNATRELNLTDIEKNTCPICGGFTNYLSADLRPVFPEERLLIEVLQDKPLHQLWLLLKHPGPYHKGDRSFPHRDLLQI